MNTRLQRFISAENLTQSQFADCINVARASVSHILSGRNKPGFDFVEKLIRAFPNLNIEWLITGKGKMYKVQTPVQPADDNLFPDYRVEESPAATPGKADNDTDDERDLIELAASTPATQLATRSNAGTTRLSNTLANQGKSINNQKNISRIIVFFDDNSFQEFK